MTRPTHEHEAARTGGLGEEPQQHDSSIAQPEVGRACNTDPAVDWRFTRRVYRDLWSACLEEAAHASVARHFDVPSHVYIDRTFDFGLNQTHYVAHRWLFCRLEGRSERMIAMAGIVAGCEEREPSAGESWAKSFTIKVPNVDALKAYSVSDIVSCLLLVGGLWPEIVSMAKERFELEQAPRMPAQAIQL